MLMYGARTTCCDLHVAMASTSTSSTVALKVLLAKQTYMYGEKLSILSDVRPSL